MELSDPELRRYLGRYLQRRLPAPEAEDALQAVYCAALEARRIPDDREELRKWLTGIARRKVAAFFERASSEQVGEPPEQSVPPAPVEARSLMRWAERQAAESHIENVDETLDWMARESDGEKLEAIAAEVALPAPRVRQRVFRLRRFLKTRWALELSVALLATAVVWWLCVRRTEPVATPTPSPAPSHSVVVPESIDERKEHAVELRREALRSCELDRPVECLRTLDEAAGLDPAGDSDPSIVAARKRALEKLVPPPKPPVQPRWKHTGTPTTGTGF